MVWERSCQEPRGQALGRARPVASLHFSIQATEASMQLLAELLPSLSILLNCLCPCSSPDAGRREHLLDIASYAPHSIHSAYTVPIQPLGYPLPSSRRKMLLSTAANGFEPNSVGQHIGSAGCLNLDVVILFRHHQQQALEYVFRQRGCNHPRNLESRLGVVIVAMWRHGSGAP